MNATPPRLLWILPVTTILLAACNLPAMAAAPSALPVAASSSTTDRRPAETRALAADPTASTTRTRPTAGVRVTDTPPATIPPARTPPTIDDFFARCPTAEEIAALRADFSFSFEDDPTAGMLVCRAAEGSADLTALQKRAYQSALVMRYMTFEAPLPWTSRSLYDWFTGAIRAVRFRDDIPYSYCCDPAHTINILVQPNSYLLLTDRWVDPALGGGLMDTMVLFVHEARHNEGYGHTCHEGRDDRTLAEMGAWGVQYYLLEWLAQHADREFLRARGEDADLYRRWALDGAQSVRNERFCDEPALTPGATPTLAP